MVVGTYEKPPYEIREHSRTADIQQYTKTKERNFLLSFAQKLGKN